MSDNPSHDLPEAQPRRRHFALIWLIPIVAAAVAIYLGYNTLSSRGPLITVHFDTADGLTVGQTQVRYKSVPIGTVERIDLDQNLQGVTAKIRMTKNVTEVLTDHARFWVVRPRFSPTSVSGLETIVSGSYIEMDPGVPGGHAQRVYKALSDPPGNRSDEKGTTFLLSTNRLGSINRGSPVFFRDVQVGEVLSYDQPGIDGAIRLRIFVRAPFDGYVRDGSRFWNASGVRLDFGAGGVRLEVESLRAALAGGIAFDTPHRDREDAAPAKDHIFALFSDVEAARAATSQDRLEFVFYPNGSVRGLEKGAAVEMRGIRIGSVTSVELTYDQKLRQFRVPVRIAVEPDRIAFPTGRPNFDVQQAVRTMVAQGLRAQLRSGNMLTGQKVVGLDFVPNAPPAEVEMDNGTIVVPTLGGDGDDIMAAVSAVAGKLQNFPLDQIGQNLNNALASVSGVVAGPDVKNALRDLSATLKQVRELVKNANHGMEPVLRRLPGIADNLDQAVARANTAIGSVERGYGADSSVNRQLSGLMQQVSDAARSLRLLADFLNRHPEALIRGRSQ